MKKTKLATVTTITTTYAGESAGKYIAAALLSSPTLSSGFVTIKLNIKTKETVKKLATAGLLADATCDFTPTGSVTLTERVLTPKELQVNVQLCKKDFRSDWDAIEMGFSVYDTLPKSFQDFILAHVIASVAQSNEVNIYAGNELDAGEFGGFIELMTADATVLDVAGAAGGVTATNVIAELAKVVDKIPNVISLKTDLELVVAPNVAKAYRRAMSALGFKQEFYSSTIPMEYEGVKLVVGEGLPASYMIAAQVENLWFGTGLLDDANEVKVLDMAELDGSQNVRIVMRFTAGVQYGIGAECVLYTPGA
jgi:hypothetical protein